MPGAFGQGPDGACRPAPECVVFALELRSAAAEARAAAHQVQRERDA